MAAGTAVVEEAEETVVAAGKEGESMMMIRRLKPSLVPLKERLKLGTITSKNVTG